MYLVKFGKLAEKDKKLLKGAGLDKKAKELMYEYFDKEIFG